MIIRNFVWQNVGDGNCSTESFLLTILYPSNLLKVKEMREWSKWLMARKFGRTRNSVETLALWALLGSRLRNILRFSPEWSHTWWSKPCTFLKLFICSSKGVNTWFHSSSNCDIALRTCLASILNELIMELRTMTTLTTSLCSETSLYKDLITTGGIGLPSSTTGAGGWWMMSCFSHWYTLY